MSYLRPLETDVLPQLSESPSARRIRALEEELAARHVNAPRASSGILKYNEYDNGGGSVTRRAVAELQEQVKSFRDELRKKDHMIQHLVSLESAPRPPQTDASMFEPLYQADKTSLERARSEMAALQVRYDRLLQQYKETDVQIEARDIKIKELQSCLETGQENEVRLSGLVQSLRERVVDLENQIGSFQTVSNRGEFTISALQKELRESNDKVVELESRLRQHLDEQDSTSTKVTQAERRLKEFVFQISNLIDSTEDVFDSHSLPIEHVVRKLTDLVQENALLKGKLVTLSESLTSTQVESKASRETIMRLVSEMGREQKVTTKYTAELEKLRMEREYSESARCDLEREIQLLKERLEAQDRTLDATKAELELRDNRLSALDKEIRVSSHSVHSTATAYHLFREQLANVLSTAFEQLDNSEESLKAAVQRLAVDAREQKLRTEEYEARIQSLTHQLDNQLEMQRELAERARKYETGVHDLDSKLRTAEGELAAGDVLRDGFRTDKEKYLRGLQRLGEIMKMDRISLDLGLDMTLDALLSRAEQLVKLETNALADRSTHVYNLQRKLKNLKEQLESKELHIDLLRKKLTGLEERVHGRVELEKNVEVESHRVRKLERLVEKYKLQLTDARQEIQNLKAQLLGTTELKMRTIDQQKDVQELAKQVEELEEERRKQARKISVLKEEVATNGSQAQESRVVADNAVQALSSELRTTKNALDAIKYREKQLLDFRGVVSRMLGLDVNTLAIPDYEIITRLEKLIKAHHATALTTIGLEEALADAHDGGVVSELEITDPVVGRSRERSRRRALRSRVRARSMSPTKRDPRVY